MQESGSLNEATAIQQQKFVCDKYSMDCHPVAFNSIVAVAVETFIGQCNPVNGLRQSLNQGEDVDWFIWMGEYSNDDNFFKPIHVQHLLEICPEAINFLGLPAGWRFLFDGNGYEDVWYDQTLLNI
jgi:hypothetical protein